MNTLLAAVLFALSSPLAAQESALDSLKNAAPASAASVPVPAVTSRVVSDAELLFSTLTAPRAKDVLGKWKRVSTDGSPNLQPPTGIALVEPYGALSFVNSGSRKKPRIFASCDPIGGNTWAKSLDAAIGPFGAPHIFGFYYTAVPEADACSLGIGSVEGTMTCRAMDADHLLCQLKQRIVECYDLNLKTHKMIEARLSFATAHITYERQPK